MTQITKILALATALLMAVPASGAPLQARQLAGEGNACSSLLSSTDNGVGYGLENAEDNTANLLKGGAGGGVPKIGRRQGDKIANGASNLLNAAGQPVAAGFVKTYGDNIDGQLTDDATNAGAQLGADEEGMLESIGSSIP
ncbi:hypothetical protein F5X68DRAFT_229266 [Plectosphaerella plurivora]|uniref:Uncharacterized protein n=1 Tax=Plectosphaerella plurivora TaxID=936078 RepID=A0A9P8VGU5_9PEZI|nr:hypothetical protein F5X68DRAFT_229266 [Plectosphaerella plurivora]